MKKQVLILSILILISALTYSQVYERPIAGEQSHPELEITKIIITDSETIISLKVTNKRDHGGWFCADENIYIKNSKGPEKYPLIKSENIPICPNQHKFANTGDFLEFNLYFEKISSKIKFINLIENCDNACFSFYSIILDNEHNEKIRTFEIGFELYQNNKPVESIPYLEKVLQGSINTQSQIYGLANYYLILIYSNLENTEKVDYWYEILKNSDIQDKETFINELKNTVNQ